MLGAVRLEAEFGRRDVAKELAKDVEMFESLRKYRGQKEETLKSPYAGDRGDEDPKQLDEMQEKSMGKFRSIEMGMLMIRSTKCFYPSIHMYDAIQSRS